MLLAGVALFCAGVARLGARLDARTMLIVGRVIMGVGAAAREPGTLSLIRQIYPDDRQRARALGVWTAVSGISLAVGPVLGGVLVGLAGWRGIFWFNVGLRPGRARCGGAGRSRRAPIRRAGRSTSPAS